MRIIVSDSSCLIDLRKVRLLDAFVELPFELVIPDVLLANELLSLTRAEHALIRRTMEVAGLDGDGVLRAEGVAAEVPALSILDAFAFVIAEERKGSILLTGDRRLRNLGERHKIEVHGVLWVVEEIARHKKRRRSACTKRFARGGMTPRFGFPSRSSLGHSRDSRDADGPGQAWKEP